MRQLDAKGLACPEPLLLFGQEIQKGGSFELTVDTMVAKENIMRFCKSKGIDIKVTQDVQNFIFKVEVK